MEFKDIASRNYELLQRIAYDLQIKQDIKELLEKYISIFTSYEEDRERLRIIAVKKDSSTEKKQKREVLVLIGKRVLKKMLLIWKLQS